MPQTQTIRPPGVPVTSYRPITDVWILARPKVAYYGAYPAGFLDRARALLGVTVEDPVLHVCSGKVRDYPFRGLGPNDKTVDLDSDLAPDFVVDVRHDWAWPWNDNKPWPAILMDPPYTETDAGRYRTGRETLPDAGQMVKTALAMVRPGGRVGILHYLIPRPPKTARFVACIGVMVGFGNRMRAYSVFERPVSP